MRIKLKADYADSIEDGTGSPQHADQMQLKTR